MSIANSARAVLDLGMIEDGDFDFFRNAIYARAGISLSTAKKELLQSRLRARLAELGLSEYGEYRRHLERLSSDDPEWQNLINLLTTNKTEFFRENDHFKYMQEHLVPEWRSRGKPVSIWSAACSTGEEPYTISMILGSVLGAGYEIRATDIDTEVLRIAKNGVYPLGRLDQVPNAHQSAFLRGSGEISHWVKLRPELKRPVEFQRLNLTEPPFPWKEKFDLIFCRNVLIYFDPQTVQKVVEGLYQAAAPGGVLFTGHSESLQSIRSSWSYLRPSVYVKKGGQ